MKPNFKESLLLLKNKTSFIFIYLFIYLLYNIVLVLPYIDMNLPWVYMCSSSSTPQKFDLCFEALQMKDFWPTLNTILASQIVIKYIME